MALPVFRSAGTKSAGTTGAVTVSAPAGVATGDLEILIAEVRNVDTCSITNDGGGAWTAMTNTPTGVNAGEKLYVWYRIRAGGDGNPQVTASADHVCAARLAYETGTFDTSDPFEIETNGAETTSDTSFSFAPGTSTGGDDRLVCVISTILRDSNTASVPVCTNAALTALASRANYCTNSGAGGGFGVTEGAKATAGAVGTFACTYGAASPKSYISFAIKPALAESFIAFDMPLGLTVDTAVTRETFAAFDLPLGLQIDTAVTRETFAAFDFPLGLQIDTNLVVEGAPEHLIAFDMPLGFTIDTALTRETFAAFDMPLSLDIVTNLTIVEPAYSATRSRGPRSGLDWI